jgi:hypothetical protein
MSFELQQVNHCGVASLQYALSLFGIGWRNGQQVDLRHVRRIFRKTWFCVFRNGVTEHQIAGAAKRVGLSVKFHSYEREEPDRVIADMNRATEQQHVVLTTWHDGEKCHFHWVCVAGFGKNGRVLLLDPALIDDDMPPRTLTVLDEEYEHSPGFMSLARFRAWITPDEDPEDDSHHFFMELWPAADHAEDFVPGMVDEHLFDAMKKDPELMTEFDEYMDDLRTIFDVGGEGTPAHEYLTANRAMLLELVDRWTLSDCCPTKYYRQEIDSLIALTRCYGFCVPAGADAKVLSDLAFYLGWRACEYSHEVGRYE